jgi:hypothetical protein
VCAVLQVDSWRTDVISTIMAEVRWYHLAPVQQLSQHGSHAFIPTAHTSYHRSVADLCCCHFSELRRLSQELARPEANCQLL